jgi:hypothetical protein
MGMVESLYDSSLNWLQNGCNQLGPYPMRNELQDWCERLFDNISINIHKTGAINGARYPIHGTFWNPNAIYRVSGRGPIYCARFAIHYTKYMIHRIASAWPVGTLAWSQMTHRCGRGFNGCGRTITRRIV